jgi:hypothetical protein
MNKNDFSNGGGNFFARIIYKRTLKRRITEIMEYVEAELERGVHPNDLLVYSLSAEVFWNQELQVWTVQSELRHETDELIELVSGRGGAVEGARIVEHLGGLVHSLRFDIDVRSYEQE